MKEKRRRCAWVGEGDLLLEKYHDTEWGVPLYDDQKIFESLVLESFQAGLSWRTILHKREHFRRAFAGFAPKRVAAFGARDVARLLRDASIVRNRVKIEATINNAKRFLEVQKEFGDFSTYMWGWVSTEAAVWARDLTSRGFRFLGPTTIYAHMQAVGMVNDHERQCFRFPTS